jgi:hypothetical protein
VDDKRFDSLTRQIGEQTDRRGMIKTAAGGALALLGVGALGRAALADDVEAEGKGFENQNCKKNKNCKRGLYCDLSGRPGICKYNKKCGGKKNDACKHNNDCCNKLVCQNRKCKRKNK